MRRLAQGALEKGERAARACQNRVIVRKESGAEMAAIISGKMDRFPSNSVNVKALLGSTQLRGLGKTPIRSCSIG
jgi:hypothetical protein